MVLSRYGADESNFRLTADMGYPMTVPPVLEYESKRTANDRKASGLAYALKTAAIPFGIVLIIFSGDSITGIEHGRLFDATASSLHHRAFVAAGVVRPNRYGGGAYFLAHPSIPPIQPSYPGAIGSHPLDVGLSNMSMPKYHRRSRASK